MEAQTADPHRLSHILADLNTRAGDCISLYVRPGSFPSYVEEACSGLKFIPWAGDLAQTITSRAVVRGIRRYGTGAAAFWPGDRSRYIILPPFPIREDKAIIGKPDMASLCAALSADGIVAVVLTTWGTYSIGIFEHDQLAESKTGTGHIHKEHKKGGSSAQRFARRIEGQKKEFLRRVARRIEERLGNQEPDYIFFGGNRLILQPLLAECNWLAQRKERISPRILDVRQATAQELRGSHNEISRSLVFHVDVP